MGKFSSEYLFRCVIVCLFAHPAFAEAPAFEMRKGLHWGAVPVTKYTTDQGFTLGAFVRRFNYGSEGFLPFADLVTMQVSYATLGPRMLLLSYEKTHVSQMDLRLYFELSGLKDTFHRYYGLGDQTGFDSSLENSGFYYFNRDSLSIETTARKRIAPGLDLKGGIALVGYLLSANSSNTQFAQDFGVSSQSGNYTRLQLGVLLEGRDFEFIPSKGYFGSANIFLSPALLGTNTDWQKFDFEFRYYIPIIDNRWLWLANQVRYSATSPSTPLIEKSRLGSSGTLRGLPLNRFITNHAMTLRTELRSVFIRTNLFSLPLKGGLGLFLDSGRTGENLSRLFQTKHHTALGVSIYGSYFTDDFLGGADIGFSEDGTVVYVGFGHAF